MKVDKTQKEFDEYLNKLSFEEKCKYMEELFNIINTCSYPLFKCKFRKKDAYKSSNGEKHECERQHIARIRKLLG